MPHCVKYATLTYGLRLWCACAAAGAAVTVTSRVAATAMKRRDNPRMSPPRGDVSCRRNSEESFLIEEAKRPAGAGQGTKGTRITTGRDAGTWPAAGVRARRSP